MDVTSSLTFRLKQILSKLKLLNVVRSYTLKIHFGRIGEELKDCLIEVNALLRKCVKKIRSKPRRAEIRNVIGELVRKKNTKRLKDEQANSEVTTVSENEDEKCQKFESEKMCLCEFCGFQFVQYSGLKVHILKVHDSGLTLKAKDHTRILKTEDQSESIGGSDEVSHQENRDIENPSYQSYENPPADSTPEVSLGEPGLAVESYLCPQSGCQRIFQNQGSLKKHIRLKHRTKAQFRCSKCEKVFFEKGKLNRHVLIHQRGQLQCSKCRQTFHRRDNLKRHFALHHENYKAFECGFCKKKFSLKFNRDTHESNVHRNAEIQCESCGKKCKNEATLKVHKRLHEESRISCSLCCKTFTRKAQYKNHLKNKHKGLSPFQKLFDSFALLGSNSPS